MESRRGFLSHPPEQLRAFVRDGRIETVPAKRTRRRQLLDEVAQAFEPGRRYPEAAVDEVLKSLIDDHCALRRYLVDEDFLSRTPGGEYWRSGGGVDVDMLQTHGGAAKCLNPADVRWPPCCSR